MTCFEVDSIYGHWDVYLDLLYSAGVKVLVLGGISLCVMRGWVPIGCVQ